MQFILPTHIKQEYNDRSTHKNDVSPQNKAKNYSTDSLCMCKTAQAGKKTNTAASNMNNRFVDWFLQKVYRTNAVHIAYN